MTRAPDRLWDLVVIGGGSAGIVGARTAVQLGASVALIERHRTGGDCLWTGCVPSKALIASAGAAAAARSSGRLGIHVTGLEVVFREVMSHVHSAILDIEPVDSRDMLEAHGIAVITGTARFSGPGRLDVDGRAVRFRQALIAAGARPAIPPIPGLASFPTLTSDSLWHLEELPPRLAVLGGGSIGCELGQAFARLGSHVTVVEGAPGILPREDPQAARVVHESMSHDGVVILTGRPVTAVAGNPDGSGNLTVGTGSSASSVEFDRLLVAVGRVPNTGELGLDAVGVDLDTRGYVMVDPSLRTSNRRIWAAGDLTGHPQFTHVAGVHGSLAASNAVLGVRRKVDLTSIPRVTFTEPEVAAVGAATCDQEMTAGVTIVEHRHIHVDRAVTEDDVTGFARLAVDRKGRIVGATLVGPRAGETLAEVTLAVRKRMRTRDLVGTIHPYPTYADGVWNASIADFQDRLQKPALSRLTRILAQLRRMTLRSTS